MASLFHNIMLPDDKVRHQYCPKGKESWCKYQRGRKLQNQPHHLHPVFLSLLEPIYTKRLGSYELLLRCLPGVTQNQLDSINSRLWERAPKPKFHGSKRIQIAACSIVVYYNKGATGKFGVLSALNLPVFQSSKELAMQKDEE